MVKNLDQEGIKSIVNRYDLFFIDLWGVVHNGIELYENSLDVLDKLTAANKNFVLLTKSFRNFPEKWHGLRDKETRFRQRYLDFVVNDSARNAIKTRFKVLQLIRTFMTSENFLEVETPTLQPKAGGAIARPFLTHHNAMAVSYTHLTLPTNREV